MYVKYWRISSKRYNQKDNKLKYLDIAKKSIDSFSIDESDYQLLKNNLDFNIRSKSRQNKIFLKDKRCKANFSIDFGKSSNCKLYIGSNIAGNIRITFSGNNSSVYIGNNCRLNKLQIRSKQDNDLVAMSASQFCNR